MSVLKVLMFAHNVFIIFFSLYYKIYIYTYNIQYILNWGKCLSSMSVLNVLYKNVCPQSRLSSKSPVLNVACPQCRLSSTSLLSFQKPTIKYHLVLNVSEWCFIACEKTAAEQKAPLVILTIPRLLTLISSYLFSSSNTLAFLPENSRKCLRKVLATRCDPSQRHA